MTALAIVLVYAVGALLTIWVLHRMHPGAFTKDQHARVALAAVGWFGFWPYVLISAAVDLTTERRRREA